MKTITNLFPNGQGCIQEYTREKIPVIKYNINITLKSAPTNLLNKYDGTFFIDAGNENLDMQYYYKFVHILVSKKQHTPTGLVIYPYLQISWY